MSQQDPDEDRRTAGASGGGDLFDQIIAAERAKGWDPQVPESGLAEQDPDEDAADPDGSSAPAPGSRAARSGASAVPPSDSSPVPPSGRSPGEPEEEEHYIPPEPPPMPRIGLTAAVGLALLTFGVVLLVMPGVFGVSYSLGLPMGLLSLALGLGWIIHNAVRSSYPHDGDDGTAV